MGRTSLLMVAVSLGLVACGDGIGPPPGPGGSDRVLHHLRWAPDLGSPTFATVGGGGDLVRFEAPNEQRSVNVLDAYQTSFWARRGATRGVEIRYQAADGTWQPYVRLTVPGDALDRRPDGSLFAAGDSVWITVGLDSAQLVVQLEPTGLVFKESSPAQFDIWYTGADPDLDGSGAMDQTDRDIEVNRLAVWVQEGAGTPWSPLVSAHSLDRKLFTAGLRHFSGHAVSH